jgi:hypothetical protein
VSSVSESSVASEDDSSTVASDLHGHTHNSKHTPHTTVVVTAVSALCGSDLQYEITALR